MQGQVKQRDPYFDNLKGVLIILVVAGHLLNLYRSSNVYCNDIFHVIYAFHMPLFFYISGYFSKNVEKTYKNAFVSLIIPAIPFELLYFVMHAVTKADNAQPFLTPVFAYWFCFALFFCRMLLPYLSKVRWIVPITFALALAAGFNPYINEIMTLSRFLCMLPFFMLGYFTSREAMEQIRSINTGLALLIGFAGLVALFTILYISGTDLGFTLRSPYETPMGVVWRAAQFMLAVPLSLMVMKLTPDKKSYLTVMGQKALQIYFLHFYFRSAIEMVNPLAEQSLLNCVIMLIGAPLIAALLSVRPVSICYDALVNATKKLLIVNGED